MVFILKGYTYTDFKSFKVLMVNQVYDAEFLKKDFNMTVVFLK